MIHLMTSYFQTLDLSFQTDTFLSNNYKRQLCEALFPGHGFWPGEQDEQPPS